MNNTKFLNIHLISNKFPKERQYGTRDQSVGLMQVPEAEWISFHNEWSEKYAADVKNGLLDDVMWSIFEKPFVYENGLDYMVPFIYTDTKFHNCSIDTATPIFHDFCCIKNDSFKLDFIMAANGMDEEMDGTHGYQDTELARRLSRVYGCQFFAMNTTPSTIINSRYLLEPRKSIKGYNNNNIIVRKNMKETPLTNNTIIEWKKIMRISK